MPRALGVSSRTARLLVAVVFGATVAGCTAIAERVAQHLVEKDVKKLDHDFELFEGDLALFRKCLGERGGSCQGAGATALPHSTQEGATIQPTAPGSSATLAESVARLPSGHPARTAHAVLPHPVVRQAAALHDHLRGVPPAAGSGLAVESGTSAAGGRSSTVTLELPIGRSEELHDGLLSSTGNGGWEALHDHCRGLLERDSGGADRSRLEADCRRIAFIRGYLAAYFRKGEFVEVDVELAGAIRAVNRGAREVETSLDGLKGEIARLEAEVGAAEKEALQKTSADAAAIASEVEALISRVEGQIVRRYGARARRIFEGLAGLTRKLADAARKLAESAEAELAQEVESALAAVDRALDEVQRQLGELETEVGDVDEKVVAEIDDELGRADRALSNVFKVTRTGFVSRDATFQARLPTLQVVLDPTVRRLITVEDVDTGQTLTGASDLADLGVATDASGVGTGSSIGAEIVRVFLEAIFDAGEGLPAVAAPNAPRPTGLDLGPFSLPLFTSPMGNVDAGDLTRMTHTNDQVAARTRAITARVIAGIGPFSLNNAALEDFLVEIIATSVRKATAKATWCWYACNLDVDLATLGRDADTAVDDKVDQEKRRIDRYFDERAEKVRLRLRLSE
ncbi:MAG: hypothetical protein R3325_00150 [Thermoanaerobaculia bacterium]|nr:hypothetical protein [Thermoanaerobaculia bacterium]